MSRDLVVGVGELLWDVYADGKRLGGTPCNFAYHAAALGDDVGLATRVGNDALGREALERLRRASVSTEHVQVDSQAPTATTHIQLNDAGEPRFTIPPRVAWDHLEWTAAWDSLARRADVVCYGSLALRSQRSRETVLRFLRAMRPDALRVFDVNVRHARFSPELLAELLDLADLVKLNERDAGRLAEVVGLPGHSLLTLMQRLRARHDLTIVTVTRGSRGSVLVAEGEPVEHGGYTVDVVDTTGAGDAFTAAFSHFYRQGASLATAADAANRLAAWVTTQRGATPPIDAAVIAGLVHVPNACETPEPAP
jgi:fructokinase